jgi:hypothetical protein
VSDSVSHPLWVVRMVIDTSLRDVEGRLLRENRAPAEAIRPGEIEMKKCPYSGSRQTEPPMPMNMSALRSMKHHWDDVINSVCLVRGSYSQITGITQMGVFDLWRVSQLGSALPWYYIFAHGELAPVYAASLAKATLGMGIWAQTVYVRMLVEQWTPPPMTSETILELAEGNGTLLAEREVCAAPVKMLTRFYDALLDLPAEVKTPHMQRLVDNGDAIARFGAYYTNMKLALYVMFLARRFVYADLLAVLPDREVTPHLRELFEASCEPPDMIMIALADMPAMPLVKRAGFLASLVMNVLPMTPDKSDVPLQAAMVEVAAAMLVPDAPIEVIAEVIETQAVTSEQATIAARAIATWARLDHLFARVVGIVENGMRSAASADPYVAPIRAEDRDRLVLVSGRPVLTRLAPRALSSLSPV